MNINQQFLTFESLPNEILLELFEYVDCQELFKLFYNLNQRLNTILQSLSHLCFYFRPPNDRTIDYTNINSRQIYTLNIDSQQNLYFKLFTNLHRLIIRYPTDDQLLQINLESFPYLQYLSVSYTVAKASICALYRKVFSNGFPLLKSCLLAGRDSPINTSEWKQSPNIEYLSITSNYPSVLNSCPNLYSLNLTLLTLDDISIGLKPHFNLKRMKLMLTSITWLNDETYFENLFLSIPSIEYFSLYKIFSVTNSIDLLMNYNWLSIISKDHLPLLKKFIYHLHIFNLFHIDQTDIDQNLPKIQENFLNIYQNSSKYILKIQQYNT